MLLTPWKQLRVQGKLGIQTIYRKKFGNKPGGFPRAKSFFDFMISLPIYPYISSNELFYIFHTGLDFYLE